MGKEKKKKRQTFHKSPVNRDVLVEKLGEVSHWTHAGCFVNSSRRAAASLAVLESATSPDCDAPLPVRSRTHFPNDSSVLA